MVTSHDVARYAGVSQATVSRVLNNNPTVDEAIRQRVLTALEETGYVPNAQAKAMRRGRAGAIGIVTSEILNPFLPYLLDELTRAARRRDLNVIVWNDGSPDVPMAVAGARSGTVDGLLFMAARSETVGIDDLIRRGFPIMLCNRAADSAAADIVMSDHYGSGYAAAQYFVQHGRSSIAAVFGAKNTFASPARERGFRTALADAGIELREAHVHAGSTTYETGSDAVEKIMASHTRPDAIFCSSDIIAYGALDALRERGVRVPDDLWVAGIDGLPMSAWRSFDLTTQQQRIDEIAEKAIDGLIDRIGGGSDELLRTLIPTNWVVRSSTNRSPAESNDEAA